MCSSGTNKIGKLNETKIRGKEYCNEIRLFKKKGKNILYESLFQHYINSVARRMKSLVSKESLVPTSFAVSREQN